MQIINKIAKNDKLYYSVMTILLVGLLICSSFLGKNAYLTYKTNDRVYELARVEENESGVSYEENSLSEILEIEGNVDSSIAEYANIYYASIPWEVRASLEEDGWRIILTDKDLQDNYYDGDVKGRLAGLTVFSEKTIYVYASKRDIRRSLIHEVGHYVDYKNGFVSKSDKFKSVFNKEKSSLKELWKIDDHNTSNSTEFFAEVFNKFVVYNEDCKEEVPKSYKCIKNALKN